ncbi:MAG: PEP-CTERM sorting domain-containing protein [Phycisphaeraceae bacterium]|nr:PEP-CTERM sorting domain-containing protein [Phycisphaeraceae bacterium]
MFKTSLLAAVGVLASAQAFGGVIASDDFNSYSDGNLVGQGVAGSGWAGGWINGPGGVGDKTVAGGAVQIVGSNSGAFRELATPFGTSQTIWISFDFHFTPPGNAGTVNTFGGLSLFVGTAGSGEKTLLGDAFKKDVWGISSPGGLFENTSVSVFDAARTAVARITINDGSADVVDLWVGDNDTDPVDVSGGPLASLDQKNGSTPYDFAGVDHIRLGSGAASQFDNIILGDTAADVGAVPEPGSLALLGLGGLALIRRRRG